MAEFGDVARGNRRRLKHLLLSGFRSWHNRVEQPVPRNRGGKAGMGRSALADALGQPRVELRDIVGLAGQTDTLPEWAAAPAWCPSLVRRGLRVPGAALSRL